MRINDTIKIRVQSLIPAPKWRVIRIVTKVWEFPSYIPSIKEATVIQKIRNKMKTKWRIQVDKVPISWIEEDTLNFRRNTINFKALEGDLEEFGGSWKFKTHPQGTLVSVEAYLRIDIPAIKDFAESYIKEMLSKNFELILKSIEKRIISLKYASLKSGGGEKNAGFGVIGHFYNFYHLERCLKMLNPKFKMPSREFLAKLFEVTPSFKLYDTPHFKSKTGQAVNGCFILATFIPDMIDKDMWTVFSKVVRACKIAEKYGVGVVSLGGFASIVAERIGEEINAQVDVPVTTGNTFAAAMVLEGIYKGVSLLGKDISSLKAVVVGGTGDIGSACSRVLAEKVKQLIITGRTKPNLRRLRAELVKKRKAQIIVTVDNEAAVGDADIVIAAASVSASILEIDWFKAGAVVCDVAYPKNISYAPTAREDLLIFSGGLAKSPTPISFPVDTGLPVNNVLYGCFAESIILALEKRYENYSFGRGNITPEKIQEITDLGKKHGFEVSDFWWGNKLVDKPVIDKIKEAAARQEK